MSVFSSVVMLLIVALLSFILFYQIRLIKKLSEIDKANDKKKPIEQEVAKNGVLTAVIIAAINQHKIQNSQRQ